MCLVFILVALRPVLFSSKVFFSFEYLLKMCEKDDKACSNRFLSTVKNSLLCYYCGRRGGLMVSALDSGSSGLGSGPGQGRCVVFLGKTLYSHGSSLHPGL